MGKKFSIILISSVAAWFFIAIAVAAQPQGADVYAEHCAVCHGDKGDAMTRARRGLNPPPRDFTTEVARAQLSRERMINSVAHGRPGTAMMAFADRISGDEIAAVVDYIREKFMIKNDVTVDSSMLRDAQGYQLYVSNCAVCHGDEGSGAMWTKTSLNPPPRDFTTSQAMSELSKERMLTSVTYGRPGTAMMSFRDRLSEDEIETVVDYVRNSFLGKNMASIAQGQAGGSSPRASASPHASPSSSTQPVVMDMTAAMPKELVGNVDAGREFFQSNCFSCHGKRGDGQGPRAAFNRPPPRNFLSDDARKQLNRPTLFAAITQGRKGTVMPAWGKVLTEQEIADVAEYVFVAFIQGGDAIDPAVKKKVDSR